MLLRVLQAPRRRHICLLYPPFAVLVLAPGDDKCDIYESVLFLRGEFSVV